MSQVICSSQPNLRPNGVAAPGGSTSNRQHSRAGCAPGNVFDITKAVRGEQRAAVLVRERDGGRGPASGASQCYLSV
jgi:hypothetical protein